MAKISSVSEYFNVGCGRCKHFDTPQCKVHVWHNELAKLRSIVLETGLTEELKWSQPCYTLNGKNILFVTAFKDYCCLAFFKGSLLRDEHQILVKQGENVQGSRLAKFTDIQQIIQLENVLKAYIFEAIEVEKQGIQVAMKKTADYPTPEELKHIFEKDVDFKNAFYALTQGRQRGWLLHFSQAKQATTRISRIEKAMPKIFDGKGWNE